MSHSLVRRIFNTKLKEYAQGKVRVSYDNVPFEPTANETYLVAHLIPADTDCETLSGDHTAYIGIYQIKVVTGSGLSTKESDALANGLKAVFPTYGLFTDGGFAVQTQTPVHVPEGKVQDGRWVVPCHFEYRADTN